MKLIVTKLFCIAAFISVLNILKAQLKDPIYLKLTSINYYNGESKEANRILAVLDKKYPDNTHILAEKGAWKYFGDDNVNEALSLLSKAIQLSPKNDRAYYLRGIMFYKKGLLEKAIEDETKAMEINPDPINYYIELGGYHYMNKNYEVALSVFLKGLDRHPAEVEMYIEVFAAYAALNKTAETTQLFNIGLAKEGMDKVALRSSYANFFMRISDFKNSAAQYQILSDESESQMTADDLNSAAISFIKLKNYQKALSFIDKAIAKKEDTYYYTNRADIAFQLYNYELSVSSATKAIELNPNNPLPYMYLAAAYKWGYKDLEKSAFYEKKAHEIDAANK